MNPQTSERKSWQRAYKHKNRARLNAYQRTYRQENHEKILAEEAVYREKNRDRMNARMRARRRENPEKFKAWQRAWYQKNRKRQIAETRKWRKKNLAKARASARVRYHDNRDAIAGKIRERYNAKRQYVAPEELKACRRDPRKAKSIAGLDFIVCLECGEKLRALGGHLKREHNLTAKEYRRKPGPDGKAPRYNTRTSLSSVNRWKRLSRACKRRRNGHWLPRSRPPLAKLHAARKRRVLSLEARLNISDKLKGKQQIHLWKKRPDGSLVTDFQIARLRLQGKEILEICRPFGMTDFPVIARLRRMGFPRGRACLFQHGEPLTSQHLVEICKDFDLKRAELARMIKVIPTNLCHRLKHHSIDQPLPLEWAKRLLRVQKRLKVERPMKSSNPKGGRPHELLPSEEKCIRRQYGRLMQDQLRLRRWFENFEGRIDRRTRKVIWGWLCEQRRLGKIQILLFWPEFFVWLERTFQRSHLQGESIARLGKPLTLEFLARSFHVSPGTVIKIVWPSSR